MSYCSGHLYVSTTAVVDCSEVAVSLFWFVCVNYSCCWLQVRWLCLCSDLYVSTTAVVDCSEVAVSLFWFVCVNYSCCWLQWGGCVSVLICPSVRLDCEQEHPQNDEYLWHVCDWTMKHLVGQIGTWNILLCSNFVDVFSTLLVTALMSLHVHTVIKPVGLCESQARCRVGSLWRACWTVWVPGPL